MYNVIFLVIVPVVLFVIYFALGGIIITRYLRYENGSRNKLHRTNHIINKIFSYETSLRRKYFGYGNFER